MTTTTILILVGVVVVIAIVAFFLTRKGADQTGALPPARPEAEPAKPEPKKVEPKKVEPTRPEPAAAKSPPAERDDAQRPAAQPAAAAARAAPKEDPVSEPPEEIDVEPEPPQRSAPSAQKRSSEADIEALRLGLKGTRGGFISRLAKLFSGKKEVDSALLNEVEEVLITADLGVRTTDRILKALREAMEAGDLRDAGQVWEALRNHAREILTQHGTGAIVAKHRPTVILIVGVNGVGKTTTIGKLASAFKESGKNVLLAAGDTFRAAAVLQLEVWGRRVGCQVVKGKDRADPASVIFDAIKQAEQLGVDVVIADTAGRLHTKTPLMEELRKVGRTPEKAIGRPADEILLVLDATTGQNAMQQAQMFKEALDVSGIVLTKLDGTAKGGVILGIVDEHKLPIRYIGIGERVEDLKEFEAEGFVEALFAKPDEDSASV